MVKEPAIRIVNCAAVCFVSLCLTACGNEMGGGQQPPTMLIIDGPRGAGEWHPIRLSGQDNGSEASRRWLQRIDDFTETVRIYPSDKVAANAFRTSSPEKTTDTYVGAEEYSIGARLMGADQVDYKCGTWDERAQCITWWAWARYGRYTVELTYRRADGSTTSLTDPQLAVMVTNAGTDVAEKYRAIS
ncbi:hypothetical protein [Actinacidiphila bryophytorum]|uniref:Uncharacterized protein n=2 Tax=Actinacidiphila bryophytorum TaxID=1436133 RepID=A0A9W4E416_9ACTN|nr:hypothetical protein [Actinacidiphila bryophytorum]CAG7624861.1 hypothetical protein SBRY_20097 [Actinacidiphila bryophytorum]